jgi:hypothetical protein
MVSRLRNKNLSLIPEELKLKWTSPSMIKEEPFEPYFDGEVVRHTSTISLSDPRFL